MSLDQYQGFEKFILSLKYQNRYPSFWLTYVQLVCISLLV
jgi:hypothetical protein